MSVWNRVLVVSACCLLLSSPAVAQRLPTDKVLPTQQQLSPFGLERAWWGQATLNASRDKVRHVTIDEDIVYVQASSGIATAFNSETGERLWATLLGRFDQPSFPAVSNEDLALMVVGSTMYGIDKRTGKTVWTLVLPGQPSTGPSVDDNQVYIGTLDGSVYAFSLKKIRQLYREQRLPQWSQEALVWRYKAGKEVTSPPIVTGRVVNFASRDGSLYAGATLDLERRLAQHRRGLASRYTRSRLPVELAWSQRVRTWSKALREERRVKSLDRRGKLALVARAPEPPRKERIPARSKSTESAPQTAPQNQKGRKRTSAMAFTSEGKRPRAVSATGYEDLGAGIDLLTAQLHYDGIPSVTISGGWHHPKAYPFSMEYTVSAEGGTIDYSTDNRPPTLYNAAGEAAALTLDDADGYAAEIQYFADCVNAGKQPERCMPRDSALSVHIALCMNESRARGGAIVLTE